MQRPNLDDFLKDNDRCFCEDDLSDFIDELNNYCGELERRLEGHDMLVQVADDLLADTRYLNKKLDKACDELANKKRRKRNDKRNTFTSEEWREWL